MDYEQPNLIIEKDGPKLLVFIFGLFEIVGGIFCIFLVIDRLNNQVYSNPEMFLTLFVLFLGVLITPAGLFDFSYAFGDKEIFRIDLDGIKTKSKTISWSEIYEIKTNSYPGPRMSYYRIKIYKDYERKSKEIIWFTSHIKTDWTEILENITFYTAKYQIM